MFFFFIYNSFSQEFWKNYKIHALEEMFKKNVTLWKIIQQEKNDYTELVSKTGAILGKNRDAKNWYQRLLLIVDKTTT